MARQGNSRGPRDSRRDPGLGRAIGYAVLVHLALIAALVVSFRWSTPPTPAIVQAVVVEEPKARPKEAESRQRSEDERRRSEQAKQAEAERQAELKQRQDEARRLKLEDEKKKKAAEEKQRAAEAKRKKEEETKRRQKEAEQSLKEQLASEEQSRAAAAREARALAEVDKFKAIIGQKVERNWNRPLGAAKGLQCTVRVRLVPGGEVLGATVVRGSGNAAFDRSVENAVHKASPLPLPSDPTLFEHYREIEFLFNPQE